MGVRRLPAERLQPMIQTFPGLDHPLWLGVTPAVLGRLCAIAWGWRADCPYASYAPQPNHSMTRKHQWPSDPHAGGTILPEENYSSHHILSDLALGKLSEVVN